jgi:hypothetical protein
MSEQETGIVVLLSGDLMFASRVKAAAESAGCKFHFGGSLPEEHAAAIRFVILDLATRSVLTSSIVGQCADRCPDAKLIAYGPHVQVPKLTAAKAAGIPIVLTRGQFDSQLSSLFG